MRKGFTMIELIFVIVILGILAAIAIPRLAATRDDAEVSKAATNLTTLISDLGAYYTSQAQFASTFGGMTNVQLKNPTETTIGSTGKMAGSIEGVIAAAGKECMKVELTDFDAATNKPAVLKVTEGTQKDASVCKKVLDTGSVQKILKGKFDYQKITTAATSTKAAVYTTTPSDAGEVAISGVGVVF
ncbi:MULTISPECIES: type II secretion system protein [unclassified Campylobacter]|uniref:type II secretion system protein n=1 Tax=unclassified Campylobacter TaxID=2593542 RepID=UPI0022E9B555|nr:MULTISPECIES: prepilin-type N-terminal cleavage/methylation domain-containing protein [unclassified Campylobacter]MDA3061884.1 prepilin-type N-terminal cleavage/methylation domain-containing protein [Campylobacter sp. JMF_14 EL1]MDA3073010.1 prepilin-type N-terminal cleavage/methylation domain-containing protein [Campylobacter sp. JMF_10 EL2]